MHAIKKSAFQLVLCSIMIFPLSSLAIGQVFLSRIDSLEAHVREGQPDTLLYSTLYALTESKAVSNTDSAVAYAKQLIALADHMKAQPQQIGARRLLGDVYRQAGMIDSVEQVVLRAIAQSDMSRPAHSRQHIVGSAQHAAHTQHSAQWRHVYMCQTLSFPSCRCANHCCW